MLRSDFYYKDQSVEERSQERQVQLQRGHLIGYCNNPENNGKSLNFSIHGDSLLGVNLRDR